MTGKHWTEQDFIDHFYGIGPDAAHLEGCGECRARSAEWMERRRQAVPEREVSSEFLAEQRRNILRRMGEHGRPRRALLPAFAATFAILLALILFRGDNPDTQLAQSAADAQLFSDIYAMEETAEPNAIIAMKALFEEQ